MGFRMANSIKLDIIKSQKNGPLGIGEIGSVLTGIQDTIYHIGESIYLGNGFRQAGKRSPIIQDRTKLFFRKVALGSFDAEIIGEPTQALDGPSIVEESIGKFSDIILILNESRHPEEEIVKILPKPSHRKRILTDCGRFWPGDDNKYEISMGTSSIEFKPLARERRRTIFDLSKIEADIFIQSAIGVIESGNFVKKKYFFIDGPGGKIKCQYSPFVEKKVIENIKHPVRVEGMAKVDENGDIISIDKITEITPISQIQIPMILAEDGEIKFNQEIMIDISFENDQWCFELDKLGISSNGISYDDAFIEFQEDFYEIYRHYALGNPSKMLKNALGMREYLLSITKK